VGLYQRAFCKLWDCIKEHFASCGIVSKSILQAVGLYQRAFCKLWDCIKEYFASCGIVSKSILQVVGLYHHMQSTEMPKALF
jgi:hypothetical protein